VLLVTVPVQYVCLGLLGAHIFPLNTKSLVLSQNSAGILHTYDNFILDGKRTWDWQQPGDSGLRIFHHRNFWYLGEKYELPISPGKHIEQALSQEALGKISAQADCMPNKSRFKNCVFFTLYKCDAQPKFPLTLKKCQQFRLEGKKQGSGNVYKVSLRQSTDDLGIILSERPPPVQNP
jgi:hypothetical protein